MTRLVTTLFAELVAASRSSGLLSMSPIPTGRTDRDWGHRPITSHQAKLRKEKVGTCEPCLHKASYGFTRSSFASNFVDISVALVEALHILPPILLCNLTSDQSIRFYILPPWTRNHHTSSLRGKYRKLSAMQTPWCTARSTGKFDSPFSNIIRRLSLLTTLMRVRSPKKNGQRRSKLRISIILSPYRLPSASHRIQNKMNGWGVFVSTDP